MPETPRQWKVYCLGTVKLTMDRPTALTALEKTFGITNDKAVAMLSGKPFLVKRVASKQAADKYLQALERCGVNASIEDPVSAPTHSMTLIPKNDAVQDAENMTEANTPIPQPSNSVTAKEFHCPKCNTVQSRKVECVKCGIIFDKYFEIQQRKQAEEEAHKDEEEFDDEELVVDPMETVLNFIKNKYVIAAGILLVVLFKLYVLDGMGYKAIATTEVAKAQWEAYQTAVALPMPTSEDIRSLLQRKDYAEVELILQEFEAKVADDIIWEPAYWDLYYLFSPDNNFKQADLDNWVAQTGSAYAYLARAAFYSNAGWEARGDKSASKVSGAQFKSLAQFHSLALANVKQAKSIDPQLLYIYTLTISLERTADEYIDTDSILKEAIALNPAAWSYRANYSEGILPKWGGSYEQVQSFIDDQAQYFHLNPMLTTLAGSIDAEKGMVAKNRNNYSLCISQYSKALEHGLKASWLNIRGWCSIQNGDYQNGIDDLKASLIIVDNPKTLKLIKYAEYKLR